MIALPQHRLDALLSRHAMVESELASGLAPDAYVKLSREFSELGPVIEAIKAYRAVRAEIDDLDAMIADSANDADMRKMAEAEKADVGVYAKSADAFFADQVTHNVFGVDLIGAYAKPEYNLT